MDDFIEIGRVVKAHGIRGEICIDFNADSSDLLWDFIFLKAESSPTPIRYKLKRLRIHKERPLLTLEGIADRNAAELLRNMLIFIPKNRLPELDEDEVYLTDLPGLNVLVREHEDQPAIPLGTLETVDDIAGQELWTIITPDGKEVLFPVAEEFVELIDFNENIAVITPPPGLLDLYLAEAEEKPDKSQKSRPPYRRRRNKKNQN